MGVICVTTCFFFSSSCLPLLSSLSPLFFVSELLSYCSSTSFCFVCYFLQSLPHRPSTSPSFFFSLPFRPLKFSDFSYHYPFPLFTIFMSLKLFFSFLSLLHLLFLLLLLFLLRCLQQRRERNILSFPRVGPKFDCFLPVLEVQVSQAFRCLRSPGGRSAVVGICSELSCPRGKFFFFAIHFHSYLFLFFNYWRVV